MPDNNNPAIQPESGTTGEFDFAAKAREENLRLKRRALKPESTPADSLGAAGGASASAQDLAREAPPRPAQETAVATPRVQASAAAKPAESSSARPASASAASAATPSSSGGTVPRIASTAASTPTTSPHGTRPATLYYSSGSSKEKDTTTPMKSTTPASSSSATTAAATPSATSAAAATPAASTAVARPSASASVRPASISDYRANVDRQAREQKSVGNILAYIVYTLIGLFVIGASLAGYGLDVLSKQIAQQSVTVSDLDARITAENKDLNAKLLTTQDSLTQALAQIGREQDLISKQQDAINKLMNANNDLTSALEQERDTRSDQITSIRARLRNLEYQGPTR
jgi:hypothetical protein